MKQRYAIIAFFLLLIVPVLNAQDRGFGLGVILGEPTGLSAKLWTTSTTAFDFGLGWSIGGDRLGSFKGVHDGTSRMHFHVDYLWHAFEAIHSNDRFPLYYGFGGRMNTGGGYDGSLAARGVIGIAWLPRGAPVDVFFELVPAFQVLPSTGIGIDAGLGARYFF
jgi:hypothetical protein